MDWEAKSTYDCDACLSGVAQSVAQGSDYQLRKEAKRDSIKCPAFKNASINHLPIHGSTPPAKEGQINDTFWHYDHYCHKLS